METNSGGLLSVPDAAARLGVAAVTLRGWLRERRLAHVRLGRRVLLDPRTLDRYVRENIVAASAEPKPTRST